MVESKFEVPTEVREFMEKSVEQTLSAFETFSGAARTVAGSVVSALPSGAKEVSGKAFSYSEANIKAACDLARKLVHAKDPQEFLQLQTDFAKVQIEAFQEQAKELGATVQKAMTGITGKSHEMS